MPFKLINIKRNQASDFWKMGKSEKKSGRKWGTK